MTRTFKGLPICEKHEITYRWEEKCCRICKKQKKPGLKKIDEVLKEMEEKGLIPKGLNDKNSNNNN